VLFQPSFYEQMPLGLPATPIGVMAAPNALTDYIVGEYRPCTTLMSADYQRFLFMTRKDLPCPDH